MQHLLKIEVLDKKTKNGIQFKESYLKNNFLFLHKEIIDYTKHLNIKLFKQKIYHYYNSLKEIPRCKCEKEIPFSKRFFKYPEYCSTTCRNKSKNTYYKITGEIKLFIKNYNLINLTQEEQVYYFKHNITKIKYCLTCNEKIIYKNYKISDYCSTKCSSNDKLKQPEALKKRIATNNKLFGVNNPMKIESIKNKAVESFKKTYANNKESILKKKENVCLQKYGVSHHMQNQVVKDKVVNSRNKNTAISIKEDFKKDYSLIKYSKNELIFICNKCNAKSSITSSLYFNRRKNSHSYCLDCNPIIKKTSSYEILIIDFLKTNGVLNIKQSNRTILDGKEIDIYLPDYKIGIEFNGLYYHSELFYNKTYHQDKSLLAKEKNIQLLHIYEDDWLHNQNIIKSILFNKIGETKNRIYARKTIVKEVNAKDKNQFLINNHLQGKDNASIKLGLYYNNKLVSLMTFGKPSIDRGFKDKNKIELKRFCNKLNTTVIGGASKLFKYFLNNYYDISTELFSYADLSYSNGGLYEKLGFTFDSITQPNYHYIVKGIREHRYKFAKHKLIKQGFNKNDTEHEIMLNRKLYRIYNSGNLKYIYKK